MSLKELFKTFSQIVANSFVYLVVEMLGIAGNLKYISACPTIINEVFLLNGLIDCCMQACNRLSNNITSSHRYVLIHVKPSTE